jgi:hypothetical protein
MSTRSVYSSLYTNSYYELTLFGPFSCTVDRNSKRVTKFQVAGEILNGNV